MGVSGGEEGARHGPSLMPGGPEKAYEALAPILTKIAAQVDDGPCVTYIGPGGAGHYVKMVHNGIEYAEKICAYAQGLALLRMASEEYGYQLNLAEIARIWKGGCIIRARLLDQISRGYRRNPALPNLLVDEEFRGQVQ